MRLERCLPASERGDIVRAFAEFAESGLASRLDKTLIARTIKGHLVEHVSRDAAAIEAQKKSAAKGVEAADRAPLTGPV